MKSIVIVLSFKEFAYFKFHIFVFVNIYVKTQYVALQSIILLRNICEDLGKFKKRKKSVFVSIGIENWA